MFHEAYAECQCDGHTPGGRQCRNVIDVPFANLEDMDHSVREAGWAVVSHEGEESEHFCMDHVPERND